jgi:subtilisin family serine protease
MKKFLAGLVLALGLVYVGTYLVLSHQETGSGSAIGISAQIFEENNDLYFCKTDAENIVITDGDVGSGFVNNELLVTVSGSVTEKQVQSTVYEYGGRIVGHNEYLNRYQVQFDRTYTKDELDALCVKMESINIFEKTKPNTYYPCTIDAFTPDDSKWKDEWGASPSGINWGAEAINAPDMWGSFDSTGWARINVGVLDNQFFTGHEDLHFEETFVNNFDTGKTGNAHGDYRHGTHVSGTIAALFNNGKGIAGIAPRVKLYAASMLGISDSANRQNSYGMTVDELEAGLTYLIAVKECRVVNFSYCWGDQRVADEVSETLMTFLDEGFDFIIVKAAGNDAVDAKRDALSYITDQTVKDHIIVVGAAELNGSTIQVADFSNFGSRVDLIAPGAHIYSSVYSPKFEHFNLLDLNESDYGYMDGTSMASPHVAGAAAAVWDVFPKLSGKQIKQMICDTATDSYGYADTSISSDRYKMLDVYAAYKAAEELDKAPLAPDVGISPETTEPIAPSGTAPGAIEIPNASPDSAVPGFDLTGIWQAVDGAEIVFNSDDTFTFDWGFGLTESGTYSVDSTSGDSFPITMNGTSLITLMQLMYGAADSSYHFEILKKDVDHISLVQVYGDYTASSSPCKLPLTRQ